MLKSIKMLSKRSSNAIALDIFMEDARRIESAPFCDHRGSFEVYWDNLQLSTIGIKFQPCSSTISYNEKAGTLRGLHYQRLPHSQAKLVSCINGSVLDVIADLRPESQTYLHWSASELCAASGCSIFIPHGFAHGFVTLTDHCTLAYLIEGDYQQFASATVRWDDPVLGIKWQVNSPILSERDRTAPDFLLCDISC